MSAFDVRAYTRDPLDLRESGTPGPSGLRPAALDAVAYLWSVEGAALDRVRDVLVTPTHADARVTAFLITWTFEQHALADRLAGVLAVNGRAAVPPPDSRQGRARRVWDERVAPTVGAVRSNLLGADVTSGQLSAGWLDAATTGLLHRRLAELDPRLAELSRLVHALKARHLEFFAAELDWRLSIGPSSLAALGRAGSVSGARRHGRRAAAAWRWPGTRYVDPGPAREVARQLLGRHGGIEEVRALDASFAAFPGLGTSRPIEAGLCALLGGSRRAPEPAGV
ncbi:hypothetical protein M3148_06015 [Georgenia satyanarayanai]|uniref:hypothetical protein n=1 Tax=Georgenia satyanarayanai TaxID=860221 RepID=UPI0020401E08|nr:hypothetical protein [Georgenia satyanarayanai]MCM3660549.1 hypothetical protein [Georgenia satyanarayanai]